MIAERVERRVLGAIEFADALSGLRVREPLVVKAPAMRLVFNASSLYVIREADGLAAHTEAFREPPATPAFQSQSFALQVSDPAGRYQARTAQVRLPRRDAPAADEGSLLRPVRIALYPSMARPVDPVWATLRVLVRVSGTRVGVANALLRLTPALAGAEASHAVTDGNGEAVLAVAGVQPVIPVGSGTGPNPVFTRNFSAALVVALDPDVVRRGDGAPPLPVPDPDLMLSRFGLAEVRKVNPPAVQMSAGISQRVEVEVTL